MPVPLKIQVANGAYESSNEVCLRTPITLSPSCTMQVDLITLKTGPIDVVIDCDLQYRDP